jgi:DNA polymerase-3 subunit epsilon
VPNPFLAQRPPIGTSVGRRPTTLSARAAELLANGPLDARSLMRVVCQVDRLQSDAAERMALALLSSHPEFVQRPSGHWALRDAPAGPSLNHPSSDSVEALPSAGLGSVSFAVVDVETTGTRTTDRITEIAIALVERGQLVDVFSQLVNPERPIPSHISALTHITWDMVKDQPPFRGLADEIARRLSGHIFTAHNAAFDWRFVGNEMARTGAQLAGPRLCTVRMAKALVPALARRSLDHVARYFNIDISGRHRAAGDAEATARALVRMLRIADDEGLSTWALLEARLAKPSRRKPRTAADRRRRAFPLPVTEDHSA